MKILLVSPKSSGIGGISQHIQNLKKFLQLHGHHVEIISSENTFTMPIKGLKNPTFILSSLIKSKFKKNFDIIHAHNIPAALAMKNFSGKKILTLHGIYSQQIQQLHGKTMQKISSNFEKNALSWADVITTITSESKEFYENLGYEIVQIPNGLDFSVLEQQIDKRFENQLIFAGRLSKEKGVETLIELSQILPKNIDLIIIGEGPEKEKIKQIDSKYSNIHYLGYKDHNETISLIKGSKILLQPSLSEGISSTILESMGCKVPVIASHIGGNLELIKNNESGILTDPKDTKILCKKIIDLINDENLQNKFRNAGFENIKQYDWNVIGKKYLELYVNMIHKN